MAQTVQHDPNGAPDKSKTYCLMNSDGSVADWFATHGEAIKAMGQTTSASRHMYSEDAQFSLTPVNLEFAEGDGVWIEALQAKDYHTNGYGVVPVTTTKLSNLAASIKNNIRGIDVSTDYEHGLDKAKGSKASGTIKDAKVDGNKLLLNVSFTDTAKAEIKAGEWKYFSSDWVDEYLHDDGTKHKDVLLGGGLTNRPVAKGLNPLPVNFSELYEESTSFNEDDVDEAISAGIALREGYQFAVLSSAQRKALPASKFLYIEPDGTKHLPVNDDAHVRAAITRLSQSNTGTVKGKSWLTDSLRSSLLAKARAMLNKKMSEGSMNELLKKLADQLGIQFSEETTEEDLGNLINTKLSELTAEVEPLRKLKESADNQKSFAEQYPDQWKQMEEDRKFRIENTSKAFAEGIGNKRFSESVGKKDAEGNDVIVTSNKGLSAKALDAIRETHLKFSEGTATVEDFSGAIDAIMNNGIVEYGERGSSQHENNELVAGEDVTPTGDLVTVRNAFAEKVNEKLAELQAKPENKDKVISFAEALPVAAKDYPKMYEAYMGRSS